MGYLDKSGLSRLWSKIKSYVTNHHMDVSTGQSPSGLTILQFGDTWSNPNLYVTGATDTYGHTTVKVIFPGFTLPTVECGTFEAPTGSASVTFTKLKNKPKIIKIYMVDTSNQSHPHGICSVWFDGKSVLSHNGAVQSATSTGFTFTGFPGEHYWEAWG